MRSFGYGIKGRSSDDWHDDLPAFFQPSFQALRLILERSEISEPDVSQHQVYVQSTDIGGLSCIMIEGRMTQASTIPEPF